MCLIWILTGTTPLHPRVCAYLQFRPGSDRGCEGVVRLGDGSKGDGGRERRDRSAGGQTE